MRHPWLHGQTYLAVSDLTPDQMARLGEVSAATLRDLGQVAADLAADWALVGGQALIAHGVPRITTGVDVIAVVAGEMAVELVARFGWTPLRFETSRSDYIVAPTMLAHWMDDPVLFDIEVQRVMFPARSPGGMLVGLLSAQHPVEFDMISSATRRTVYGESVPVAPLGWVLLVKVKADRPKDIAAVEQTAEHLPAHVLRAAVEWAEKRDPATADKMASVFNAVRVRRTPTKIEPYVPCPRAPGTDAARRQSPAAPACPKKFRSAEEIGRYVDAHNATEEKSTEVTAIVDKRHGQP